MIPVLILLRYTKSNFSSVSLAPAAAVEGRSLCNHRRAYKFFIDSVAPRCLFPSFPCESYDDFLKGHCFPCDRAQEASSDAKCGNMGYYADRSTGRGQLYLVTREEEPFCAHQFNIEIYSSENYLPLRTLGKLEAILEGDGSLNETFSITEKDDAEFVAGEVISRILVPHPALGFPRSITLTYKSYSGWLSKGLPSWTIHKIVLTDSFGESKSLCRRDITLMSEVPVYLELKNGNCYTPEENDITYSPDITKPSRESISSKYEKESSQDEQLKYFKDDTEKFREKKDIINLGTNFKITQNSTYSYSEPTDQLPWQPILEGNTLDKSDATESSRMFPVIVEPIVKSRKIAVNQSKETGRSLSPTDDMILTDQSPLNSDETTSRTTTTTEQSRLNKIKNAFVPSNEVTRSRENTFFTIQLLPFKLGDLFERAERYARETLLPLISEQAPRFFGFGAGDPKSDKSPKYFPPLGEISEETNDDAVVSARKLDMPPSLTNSTLVELDDEINKNGAELSDNVGAEDVDSNSTETGELETAESQVGESRSSKNILSLLRTDKSRKIIPVTHVTQFAERRNYYTEFSDGNIDEDLRIVHIDLPTYRPPPLISTLFPYKFVKSTEDEIRVVPVESNGNRR